MGYQLRMHNEIRDWLTGLRGTQPELARLVCEAVLAMLDAGGSLGPPLVVPLESVLRPPDDPRASWKPCRRYAVVSPTSRPRESASSCRPAS